VHHVHCLLLNTRNELHNSIWFSLQSDLAQSIFDVLKDFEDENGHLIAETFMKLPSKRYVCLKEI